VKLDTDNSDEEEFYDALENTQALSLAQQAEFIELNSPTLKLVDTNYNREISLA